MSAENSVERKHLTNHLGINGLIVSGIIKDMPRFMDSIRPDFKPGFYELYLEKMGEKSPGDKGYCFVPVLVSSHTSHADGFPLGVVAKSIAITTNAIFGEDRLKGFRIPIAASMKSGHQGGIVQKATKRIQGIMSDQYCLESTANTRDKDREKYGLTANNAGSTRFLSEGVQQGYGIAVFPETTMQGGRFAKKGLFRKSQRNGMQEFRDMQDLVKIVKKVGKIPLYIPIGIDGGYRIENPEHNKPTLGYLWETVFSHPSETKLVRVKVGLPIPHDDIMEEAWIRSGSNIGDPTIIINHILGERVAELLPLEAKGRYRR